MRRPMGQCPSKRDRQSRMIRLDCIIILLYNLKDLRAMKKLNVLIEVERETPETFALHAASIASDVDAASQAEKLIADLPGFGLEFEDDAPVPMFTSSDNGSPIGLDSVDFAARKEAPDQPASSMIVSCTVNAAKYDQLCENSAESKVKVWPNSELTLLAASGSGGSDEYFETIDLARSDGGLDCRPFRDGVSMTTIRQLLGVEHIWRDGFRGQNVVVGIVDEGVDGSTYPVTGGFSRPNAGRRPGTAPVTSHGSMCAADVLIAAPAARLYDYPFLGVPRSGGALQMFQAVLNQRRTDGTPHLTTNSYGFVGVPDPNRFPNHEVHDINHPVHRKVREVVASGAACFFAAGNCGRDCPSGNCHPSGIGPDQSIHASNSLVEVITVAAVNSHHERIGYSSQGEGMFERRKPNIASYSHIFGNFGPGRPGGNATSFDSGTSAATPVAAGVGALLLSAAPGLSPHDLRRALIDSATNIGETVGWDRDYGHGVVNAAAAYHAVI